MKALKRSFSVVFADANRSFGLTVGGVLVLFTCLPLVFDKPVRWTWLAAIGIALVMAGAALPRVLEYPRRAWMRFADMLGWLNTRIILGLVFFVILTPLALFVRLSGRRSLQLAFDKGSSSYRDEVKADSRASMLNQF